MLLPLIYTLVAKTAEASNGKIPRPPDFVLSHFESSISLWNKIRSGEPPWKFAKKGGLNGGYRRIALLNLASSLCSELSRLVLSDKPLLLSNNNKNQALIDNVLNSSNFDIVFPSFIEQVFASGGGVIKPFITENHSISLDFIPADSFIPISFDEKGAYSGIFISKPVRNGKQLFLCEYRNFYANSETVLNFLFSDDFKLLSLNSFFPDLPEKSVFSNIPAPLFSYFRPANISLESCPLGKSIYADFIDILKSTDVIFDSLEREFVLGKKRIIVPSSALKGEYDSNGNLKKYFDPDDEVWQAFSADDAENLKIIDNTSALRVNEHITALENLSDIVSSCCGLSESSVKFSHRSALTATEISVRSSKEVRTKFLHRQVFEKNLASLGSSILTLGRIYGLLPLLSNTSPPTIIFAKPDETTTTMKGGDSI